MNFRSFFKRDVLVENVPVSGEYDEWYPSLRTGVSTRSQTNDVYLFKDIANALNLTVPDAVDHVSQRLFDKLFPNNQPNPANTEDEYRDAIFNALTEIVNEINQAANTDIKNSKSQKSYTARIISALGQTVKTFNGAAPRTVRVAVNRANQQVLQEEPTPPAPPVTEIDKLKTRLHSAGNGVGVNVSQRDAKLIYGVRDTNNITATDYVQIIKNVKEKCINMFKSSSAERVVESARGILYRFAPLVTVPFYTTDEERTKRRLPFLEDIFYPSPRVKLPYDVAASNKFISANGRKLIQTLVNRYNVVAGDVYITLKVSHDTPALLVLVALKTERDRDIIYKENNTVFKKTYDRQLLSSENNCTVYEFNRTLTYSPHRLENNFYLR